MSVDTQAPHRGATVFAIPEHAHADLVQLRDHLHLMVQLTAVGTNASHHEARLRPDALAWWFSRLHKDVDGIVAASEFSAELAQAYETARKGQKPRAIAKA